MFSDGTEQPADFAARKAMTCQPVTLMSLSRLVGWYRQPPAWFAFLARFWARRISLTARARADRQRSASSGSPAMPTTSASIRVLMPWQYIGPWLEFETRRPLGRWWSTT